jgi:hypothetical protein
MKFTEFPPCRNRFACLQCRNDNKFVENMRKRFGEWECPEGIAMGTPLEEMPQHIQDKIKTYKDRLIEQGRSLPTSMKATHPTPEERRANAGFDENMNKSFVNTPMCKQRSVCIECRNNKKFRERMEKTIRRCLGMS